MAIFPRGSGGVEGLLSIIALPLKMKHKDTRE
jgi:hypothetical protein